MESLYEEITTDRSNLRKVKRYIGEKQDVHYFLDKFLHNEEAKEVLIVIDEYVDKLKELKSDWLPGERVETILFRIYERNGKRIYYFIPYTTG
ncbi:MAG: hypothetical protein QXO75_03615 [Nitrososphaerota archaeon]